MDAKMRIKTFCIIAGLLIILSVGLSRLGLANGPTCPSNINFGQTLSCSIDAPNDSDSITFLGNYGDVVTVLAVVTSGLFWPEVRLRDGSGNEVCRSEGFPAAQIQSCMLPNNGTYTLTISDSFNGTLTGEYALSLERLNPGSGPLISYIEHVSGTLEVGGLDSYTFLGNLGDDMFITLSVTSGTFWPGIRIYGPSGSALCSNSGFPTAEIATCKLPSNGTYTILIYDSFNFTLSGQYELFLGIHPEAISAPTAPVGPKEGKPKNSYSFSTGGSYSSLGHSILYLFDWGDGTNSGWLTSGITAASHSWSGQGSFAVRAQARSSLDSSILSDWSPPLEVSISSSAAGCDAMQITPKASTFPAIGGIGQITVTVPPGCVWQANEWGGGWYELVGDSQGVGSGIVTYWVSENVFEGKRQSQIKIHSPDCSRTKTHQISQLAAHWEHWKVSTLDSGPKGEKYGRAGRSTSIALDSNDKVHIAYYSDSENAVKYITNQNNRWEAIVIDTNINCLPDTTIRIDHADKVHIVYDKYNEKAGYDYDLYYANNKTGTWQVELVDYAKSVGSYSSMAIDSGGQVHIAYDESEPGAVGYGKANVKYARQVGDGWSFETVDSENVFSTMIHMTLDHNDRAHISYMDYNTRNLRYSTNVSGYWQSRDLHEYTGQYNTIAVDSRNNVHIFHSSEDWGLWYTTNDSGSWTTSLVREDANWFNSLVIDPNDVMHISSFDSFNLALKYMKIDKGIWERNYVDTYGDAGRYNDIAVDKEGKVRISYHYWSYNKDGLPIGSLKYTTNAK